MTSTPDDIEEYANGVRNTVEEVRQKWNEQDAVAKQEALQVLDLIDVLCDIVLKVSGHLSERAEARRSMSALPAQIDFLKQLHTDMRTHGPNWEKLSERVRGNEVEFYKLMANLERQIAQGEDLLRERLINEALDEDG